MSSWTTYGSLSGWVHWGTIPSTKLPGDDLWSRSLRIACDAEGGFVDMVQCYDTGIMTAGPLGATAKFHFLQRLLGLCLEFDAPKFISYMGSVLYDESEAMVLQASKSPSGYAFYTFANPVEPALDEPTLRAILLDGSDGASWSEPQRGRAQRWVTAITAMLQDPHFLQPIVDDSEWMLQRFLPTTTAPSLARVSRTELPKLTAAYLAFAINNPMAAFRLLRAATTTPDVVPTDRMLLLAEQRACGSPATFPRRAAVIRTSLRREFP